jgi:hypothetical protein
VTDSQKRAWAKPMVTQFESIDHLREYLQGKATMDGIVAIEALVDGLRSEGCSLPDGERRPHKIAAGRGA